MTQVLRGRPLLSCRVPSVSRMLSMAQPLDAARALVDRARGMVRLACLDPPRTVRAAADSSPPPRRRSGEEPPEAPAAEPTAVGLRLGAAAPSGAAACGVAAALRLRLLLLLGAGAAALRLLLRDGRLRSRAISRREMSSRRQSRRQSRGQSRDLYLRRRLGKSRGTLSGFPTPSPTAQAPPACLAPAPAPSRRAPSCPPLASCPSCPLGGRRAR